MKPIKFLISLVLLCITFECLAQKQSYKRLIIGDLVPDIEIKNIINYPTTAVKISDFKTKLLILDFWATWCSPCIASFPKLDTLQRKFGDKIKILPITSEKRKKVTEFLQKMGSIKHLFPGTATEDSILEKLFRHKLLPHYVWINKGNVIAITGSDEVNEDNIGKLIKGEKITLDVKNDEERKIIYTSENVPTFTPSIQVKTEDGIKLEKMPISSLIFYSSLTRYLEGMSREYFSFHPDIFTATNLSIFELYRVALQKNSLRALNFSSSAIVIEIKDTALYDRITPMRQGIVRGLQFEDWMKRNGYCYDIKVPSEFIDQKFDIMQSDLNRYFGIKYGIEGVMEERSTKYLALIQTTQEDKLKSRGGPEKTQVDKFSIKIQNVYLNKVVASLAQPLQQYPPIINETNYNEKVDIELNCELSDLKTLNKEFEKYGLQLIEKEKLMNVPVIRMKKNGN